MLTGTYLAIVGWAILLRELNEKVAEYSAFGPMILVIVIILAVVAGHLLQRHDRARRRESDTRS